MSINKYLGMPKFYIFRILYFKYKLFSVFYLWNLDILRFYSNILIFRFNI